MRRKVRRRKERSMARTEVERAATKGRVGLRRLAWRGRMVLKASWVELQKKEKKEKCGIEKGGRGEVCD